MSKVIEYKKVDILRQEHVVLKDINLTVDSGEIIYLMGRVGSGKSSLLKTLYGEVAVANGSIARVFDFDIMTLRRKQIPMLRRSIGIVFQDFQLLSDRNVYDNLMFVLQATGWKNKMQARERIEGVLSDAGMLNKSYKMPHELSGGEQQRVAIARAMLNSPQLIIADEPTGNLDPDTSESIVRRLHEIASRGTAVVMATHNTALVNKFEARTFVCHDKRLEEV